MLTSVLTKAEGNWRAWCDRLPPALAIGLGVVRADPEYAGRLRTAQIAAIVRLTLLTVSASCLNASILLLTFGRMGLLGPSLWIWRLEAVYWGCLPIFLMLSMKIFGETEISGVSSLGK